LHIVELLGKMSGSIEGNMAGNSNGNSMRLLLVEDDLDKTHRIEDLLSEEGKYSVEREPSLAGMWRSLRSSHFDVILLDHTLPDGSGLDVIGELRSLSICPPVLMITGDGDEYLAAEAIRKGASHFLVKKSTTTSYLNSRIQQVIQEHKARQDEERDDRSVRYQSWLLDHVRDAIIVSSDEGKVVFWNCGAEDLFGLQRSLVIGRPIGEIAKTLDSTAVADLLGRLFRSEVQQEEIELLRADGESIWLSARANDLVGQSSELAERMVILRDISQRRKLESQVEAAQFNMLQAARLSAVGEMASSLAHQINNPLTTVIGEAQILARLLDRQTEAYQSALAIKEAGWRAAKFVERLMDLSGPQSTVQEKVDVNSTVLAALDFIRRRLERQQTQLSFNLAPGLPSIDASERDLIDIWINLLIEVTHQKNDQKEGEVVLSTSLRQNFIEVKITCLVKSENTDDEAVANPTSKKDLDFSNIEELIHRNRGELETIGGNVDLQITTSFPSNITIEQ
jgi:PAS domain S-box-containing protein